MIKFICYLLIVCFCVGIVPSLTGIYSFINPVMATVNGALSTVKGIVGLDSFNYGADSVQTDIGYLVLPDGANGEMRNVKETLISYILSDNRIEGLNIGGLVDWSIPYIDQYTYIVNTSETDYFFYPDFYDYECLRFTLQVDYIKYDCLWIGIGNRNGVANDVDYVNVIDGDVSTALFYFKTDFTLYYIDDITSIDSKWSEMFKNSVNCGSVRQYRLVTDLWNELTGG